MGSWVCEKDLQRGGGGSGHCCSLGVWDPVNKSWPLSSSGFSGSLRDGLGESIVCVPAGQVVSSTEHEWGAAWVVKTGAGGGVRGSGWEGVRMRMEQGRVGDTDVWGNGEYLSVECAEKWGKEGTPEKRGRFGGGDLGSGERGCRKWK